MSKTVLYHELSEYITTQAPLLMVDRLEIADDKQSARGSKAVSMDEEFFQGHFPGQPIMPGVLQLAGMAQVASTLFAKDDNDSRTPELKSLSRLKFRKPITPGDFIIYEAEIKEILENGNLSVITKCIVDEKVASQAILELTLVDAKDQVIANTPLQTPTSHLPEGLSKEVGLKTSDIMALIPHRFPFYLIDHIYSMDEENMKVYALKNVTGNEPYMSALALPHMPSFLQTEAAAQAACAMALNLPQNKGKIGVFMSIDKAEFFHPVQPGDQVIFDLDLEARGRFGKAKGKLYVGDTVVTEVAMKFAMVASEA